MTDCTQIKAGDKVYLWHSGFNSSVEAVCVDRLTPSQIVIGFRKFKRKNGRLIGASAWSSIFIEPINAETKAAADEVLEIRRITVLRNRIGAIRWSQPSNEQIELVAAIVLGKADRQAVP